MALFLVVAASAFSRFGFEIEAWGLGIVAINGGVWEVQRLFGGVAYLLENHMRERAAKTSR